MSVRRGLGARRSPGRPRRRSINGFTDSLERVRFFGTASARDGRFPTPFPQKGTASNKISPLTRV